MIAFRIGLPADQTVYLGLERMTDGAWFDWSTGAFSQAPAARLQGIPVDPQLHGRFAMTFPDAQQQPGQFPQFTELMVWVAQQIPPVALTGGVVHEIPSAALAAAAEPVGLKNNMRVISSLGMETATALPVAARAWGDFYLLLTEPPA